MSNVLCFKFGLLAPIENKDIVNDQIFVGHKTYNNYVSIYRENRNKKRDILNSVKDSKLEALHEEALTELKNAKLAIKNSRVELRTKKIPKELNQRVSAARLALKAAKKEIIAFKKAHNSDIKPLLQALDEELKIKSKEIYNTKGENSFYTKKALYWGSNNLIKESIDQAEKTTAFYKDLKFRIWNGVGQIGLQLQENLSDEDIFIKNNNVWIERVPSENKSKRSEYKCILHLRVQSTEKRNPIFASFPMIMHRPFPKGSKITLVKVKRNKIGSREEWSVSFTLNISECEQKSKINLINNSVAVDIGWRKTDNKDQKYSLRVAAWHGDDGKFGEVKLNDSIIEKLKLERSLSSIRKLNFNIALESLINWCKNNEMPDWLKESTRRKKTTDIPTKAQAIAWMSEWKSEARLASLILKWNKNRFIGDDEIFGCRPQKDDNGKPIKETAIGLEGWRYNDFHLWNMLESIRTSIRRHRRECYRIFAKNLAEKYSTVVCEDFNISDIAQKAPIGSNKEINRNDAAQSNRQLAAPSELIECLKLSFSKVGGRVVTVDPMNTSKECNSCGNIETIGSDQIHTCSKCSSVWDRDYNSCKNQLKKWCERSGDVKILVPSRNDENINKNDKIKEARWQKLRKAKAEKKSKTEALATTALS